MFSPTIYLDYVSRDTFAAFVHRSRVGGQHRYLPSVSRGYAIASAPERALNRDFHGETHRRRKKLVADCVRMPYISLSVFLFGKETRGYALSIAS